MTQQWAGEAKPAEVYGEALILEGITLGYEKEYMHYEGNGLPGEGAMGGGVGVGVGVGAGAGEEMGIGEGAGTGEGAGAGAGCCGWAVTGVAAGSC